MKKQFVLGLSVAILCLFGLFVIAQDGDDAEVATGYFNDILEAPYTDWPFQPGVEEGYYVGQAPHGMVLRSYVNDLALAAFGSGAEAFPEGSIIVKENHMAGDLDLSGMEAQTPVADFAGALDAITYMVKVPGYNPDAGDWFWAKIQPDGTIDVAGKGAGCIGCHTQVAANDFVFNAPLAASITETSEVKTVEVTEESNDEASEEVDDIQDGEEGSEAETATLAASSFDWQDLGEKTYTGVCVACHQANGAGVPGAFPPLAGHMPNLYSAEGGREYLINVVLYGLQGEILIDGTSYNSVMTGWSNLSDEEIAATLNHELSSWGNDGLIADFNPIMPEEVAAERDKGLGMADTLELRPELP